MNRWRTINVDRVQCHMPDEGIRKIVEAVTDRVRLEELVTRVLDVETWQELSG